MDAIDDTSDLLVSGTERAGYAPGEDVSIAIDVVASHFYDDETETYRLESVGKTFNRAEMIALVVDWTETYPVVSVEDPLAEDDWQGWRLLADRIDDVQLLGDDLIVTDPNRLDRAVDRDAASAVFVKPNQAGTVSRSTIDSSR